MNELLYIANKLGGKFVDDDDMTMEVVAARKNDDGNWEITCKPVYTVSDKEV